MNGTERPTGNRRPLGLRLTSRPRLLSLVLGAALVALGACGGDEPPPGSPQSVPDATATTTTGAGASSSSTTPSTAAPSTAALLPTDHPCAAVPAEAPGRLGVEVCQVGGSGLTVTLQVRATDGNAEVRSDCASPEAAWGDSRITPGCRIGCVPGREPRPSAVERSLSHDYATAGSYQVRVTVESDCGEPPNGERRNVALDLQVG